MVSVLIICCLVYVWYVCIVCGAGHADCVTQLLIAGVEVDTRNRFKCTPLHKAVTEVAPDLVTLIDFGIVSANVDYI